MKTKIITGPIKPYENMKVGLSVLPMVAEVLQRKTENEATLALNCLDSFTKRSDYMENYLQFIKDNGIKINNKWLDSEHTDSLKREVYKLIELGYISEKEKNIHRCKCMKVEISSESVDSTYNTKCFDKKENNGKIICNFCNTEAVKQKEKVLVFTVPENAGDNINILPRHLGADISKIHNEKKGKDIVISRTRDTHQSINYNGKKYNIDVDFLLANYLSTFKEEEKVVIGSHHVVYPIYLLNLLEQCKHPNEPNNIVFVAVSYVKGLEEINFKILNNDSKKLNVVYSATNLRKPNSKWEEDNYQHLSKKLPEKAKQYLINIAYKKVERKENESLCDYVERTMGEINLQKNLSELKKLKNIQKNSVVTHNMRECEVDLIDLKKIETNELKNKAVKIIQSAWRGYKERIEKIKMDIINNLSPEKQVKYNKDTCYKYTFITKKALCEINRRYHELHGQPHYVHNFLNLRPGEHTDIAQLRPELIKKGDCYLLIPNTSYCEMKELIKNPKDYKNNKEGLRILGYYIHPEQLENALWKINANDLENEVIKKSNSSTAYNYISSKNQFQLERSVSQEKISVIETRSNKKYLASILDLDKTDLNWLKYIKKISMQHLQENYGITDQDKILMYFHFPCSESNVTLHLHIVVNGINHPIHESKSFSLDSIISCLENGMSIEDIIMSRQTIMDIYPLYTDINDLEIKQIANRYKVDLNKGKGIESEEKDVKNLKVELSKSQKKILNYIFKEKVRELDDFIQKSGVNLKKVRELRKAYQQLIKARENYNQDNITQAENCIEIVKDELKRIMTVEDVQKLCSKCEEIANFWKVEQEKKIQEQQHQQQRYQVQQEQHPK